MTKPAKDRKQAHCTRCGKLAAAAALKQKLYLCKTHYRKYVERKRLEYLSPPLPKTQPLSRCVRQSCTNLAPPGKQYCNNECARLARRIIDDDGIMWLNASSWMRSTEAMVKRHPLQFASLQCGDNDQPDRELMILAALLEAAADVEYFQRGEGMQTTGKKSKKWRFTLKPQMPVQLGHRYPASEGGSNARNALTLTPTLINKKLNARVFGPVTEWGKKHFGESIRIQGKVIPCKGGLLRQILTVSNQTQVTRVLHGSATKIARRHKSTKTELPAHPLMQMLLHELLKHGPKDCLYGLAEVQPYLPDGYDEIIAAACFIAIQTQDADSLLKILAIHRLFRSHRGISPLILQQSAVVMDQQTEDSHHIIYGTYVYDVLSKARKAIRRCFGIDFVKDPDKMVKIYQRMFTRPPADFTLTPLVLLHRKDPRHPYYQRWRKITADDTPKSSA